MVSEVSAVGHFPPSSCLIRSVSGCSLARRSSAPSIKLFSHFPLLEFLSQACVAVFAGGGAKIGFDKPGVREQVEFVQAPYGGFNVVRGKSPLRQFLPDFFGGVLPSRQDSHRAVHCPLHHNDHSKWKAMAKVRKPKMGRRTLVGSAVEVLAPT